MTDDYRDGRLVEHIAQMIAEGNNGGTWASHYTEAQKDLWRARAAAIIVRVRWHDDEMEDD